MTEQGESLLEIWSRIYWLARWLSWGIVAFVAADVVIHLAVWAIRCSGR